MEDRIIQDLQDTRIPRRGLSLSGGDPLHPHNVPSILKLVQRIRTECPGKDIWLWTGYTLEELSESQWETRHRRDGGKGSFVGADGRQCATRAARASGFLVAASALRKEKCGERHNLYTASGNHFDNRYIYKLWAIRQIAFGCAAVFAFVVHSEVCAGRKASCGKSAGG